MMDAMKVAAALRWAAENCDGCSRNEVASGSGKCPDCECDECLERSSAWFNDAADAIERSAMPEGVEWPVVGGRKVDFKTAYAPGLGVLEAVCIYSNGACAVMSHDGIRKPVSEIRPAVLAADGEPLEVGQTVWNEVGVGFKVEEVNTRNKSFTAIRDFDENRCEGLNPRAFTHQRPVLDADGAPIKKGDTVYVAPFDDPLTVRGFAADGRVLMDYHSDDSFGYRPENITHTKPDLDTWERIEEDAGKNPFDYCKDVGHRLDTCENAERFKSRDLVRRAKKLAERGA